MRSNWERAGDPKTQAFKHSVLQVFPKAKGNQSSKDPICEHQKAMPTPLASSKIRLWQSISSSNSISSNHISISSRTFSQHLQPACTWVLFISFSCSSTVMSTIDGPSPAPMAAMVESRDRWHCSSHRQGPKSAANRNKSAEFLISRPGIAD